MAATTTAAAAVGPPRPPPLRQPQHHHQQHATYEDYLDTFLTSDDAFFFDGDLDTARALVEAGLRARGGACGGAPLGRRAWTLAQRRAARHHLNNNKPPTQSLLLLSNPDLLPASECPLLALLAVRERAVRSGALAVVVFLRAINGGGQEVSAYVDLAARLGVVGAFDNDEEEEGGEERPRNQPQDENDDDDEDDGDEDAAERRAAAADKRARDASRGMAGVFARVRPFLPLPMDLCYYNHATRRARANPTAQWQVAPAFADDEGGDGGDDEGGGGGRLLLRHVRDRRVLDVSAMEGRTVVDLGPLVAGGGVGSSNGNNSKNNNNSSSNAATPQLSERSYLLQAVVFDHVVRRR